MPNAGITLFCEARSQALPTLGKDEIHVWIVEVTALDAGNVTDVDMLAPAERARASQFRLEVDQASFIQRRVALRVILAEYLGIAPQDIAFTANEYGKPSVIAPRTSAGLSFNASHSGALALIAVGRSVRIGIDVERLRSDVECKDIATRFFAAGEAASLAALHPEDRVEGFFNAWTRKEAVVKALGGGLSIPLDSFEVSLRLDEPPAILRWAIPGTAGNGWRLHHLEPAKGYVGALAVDSLASVCQCQRWAG